MTGPDLDLLRRLHHWLDPIGVAVVEIDGWQTRGRTYATFNPHGTVNHHTAGPRTGDEPSLGICINGRSDLPGPLCNVHQARSDHVNLVAAGIANHAGGGGWMGLSGNQSVWGLEVEHCGYPDEPFPDRRYDISCRVHAAMLDGLPNPDPGMNCQHFEWSDEGKIDFCQPLLPAAPTFRNRIAALFASGPGAEPEPPKETDMAAPATCTDSRNRPWIFYKGTNGECWARCAGDPPFSLGGQVTDAIAAVPGDDGAIDVYAYTPDGQVYSIHADGVGWDRWYAL